MKEVAKVVGINLGVLLLVSIVAYFATHTVGQPSPRYGGGEFSFSMLFWGAFQSVVCFITAIVLFIMKRPEYGLAFILASLVVLVLGVSLFFGGMSV